GWWEFPGGKINPGEDAPVALLRELEEELRISPEPKEKVAHIDYDYDDRSVSLQIWNCGSIEPTSITLVEHDSARWLSRDELLQVKWLPADLPIIEKWCQEGLPAP
ncbi:MAG: NUDIX domain-containing protein, partial [Candidatus Thermoplasmatota archaeon]|nr:NUDIX domain-containing protein [Candidatus Thermoplasmatota archaeon]